MSIVIPTVLQARVIHCRKDQSSLSSCLENLRETRHYAIQYIQRFE